MRLIDADALKFDIMCVYGSNPQYIRWLNHAPTVEAIPFEFIVRYGNTCDDAIKTALIDLVATWEIDSPTWKPKFNAVRMKGQKNETD